MSVSEVAKAVSNGKKCKQGIPMSDSGPVFPPQIYLPLTLTGDLTPARSWLNGWSVGLAIIRSWVQFLLVAKLISYISVRFL